MNLRVTDTFKNYLAVTLVVMITILLSSTAGGQASVGADFDFAELIRETIVYGSITRDTPAYDDYASGHRHIGEFKEGEVVEIVRDRAFAWYLVKSEDGQQGWVSADSLSIPGDPETNMEQLPQAVLEAFVNTGGLSSKTDHLVWVDLDRQLTHVFTGKEGAWSLKRTMPSSTGKNISPTLRGRHEIAERGTWFFSPFLGRGGKYWVQFSGPYMFHSLPMDEDRNIVDYTLLERRSAGCIRLSMEDSEWFYSFIKRGSTVYVN